MKHTTYHTPHANFFERQTPHDLISLTHHTDITSIIHLLPHTITRFLNVSALQQITLMPITRHQTLVHTNHSFSPPNPHNSSPIALSPLSQPICSTSLGRLQRSPLV